MKIEMTWRTTRMSIFCKLSVAALLLVMAMGGCSWYYGRKIEVATPRIDEVSSRYIPIMGRGKANSRQMARFLTNVNDDISFEEARKLAEIYIQESRAEGVNADVAFVQMCLETAFLRFGGQVSADQHNYCGLGATDDGAAGATFPTARAGVRAHIQHLKAYASREPLRYPIIDPRFDLVTRGSAPYLHQLTGKWATDPQYDVKLARLLNRLWMA